CCSPQPLAGASVREMRCAGREHLLRIPHRAAGRAPRSRPNPAIPSYAFLSTVIIPSSQRRGGRDVNKMDPFRSGAAGVVSSAKLFRPQDFAGLTTPALRATPPLRGGEFAPPIRQRYETPYIVNSCHETRRERHGFADYQSE